MVEAESSAVLAEIIRRPISVAIATLALVVVGGFSLLRLPVSLLPSLERPKLVVLARDDAMSREELRQQVVEPLERRLMSLDGVLDILARIDDGEATVVLETEWQTEVDRLRIDAERRLAEVAGLGLDELTVEVVSGDAEPIVSIAVLGGRSAHERTLFVDRVLIPEVGRLPGAGRLRRVGGAIRRPVVRPRAAALAARGLTAADVAERLETVGVSRPLGRVRDGAEVRPLVLRTPVESVAELERVRLGEGAGVALGDVAAVALEEVRAPGLFRLDGAEGVLLEVHRAPGANAVLLAREVHRLLAEVAPRSPMLRLSVVRDASREVVEALGQLGLAALLGLGLGALVLRLSLGSWRPTLALVVVVPASVLIAFGGFYWWGVSLDVVSLAGLALAGGMLVDNSIVVLEAIESVRTRRRRNGETAGASGETAEVHGARQIAMALVASFLTTAVVFVPLIYLRGLARAFFGVQAFAIVTTLAISLVLSLTLTPVLARRMGKTGGDRGCSPGRDLYAVLLDRALARPGPVAVLVLVVLAAGGGLFLYLDRELVPAGGSEVVALDFALPAGLDRPSLHRRVVAVEEAIRRSLPDLGAVRSGEEGSGEAAGPAETVRMETLVRRRRPADGLAGGSGVGGLGVELVLRFADSTSLARALPAIARQAHAQAGTVADLRLRRGAVARALEQGTRGLDLEISAGERRRARHLAGQVAGALEGQQPVRVREPGATLGGTKVERPAWVLVSDPLRPTSLATGGSMAEQVRSALGGALGGRVEMAWVAPEILLETTQPAVANLFPVRSAAGSVVPLGALASLEDRRLEPPGTRRNGRPSVRLELLPGAGEGTDGVPTPAQLQGWVNALVLEGDETVELVGRAREMDRSFGQLRLALGLALLLVFLAVAALYESLTMPWVVMTTVPVAAAGALAALALGGQSFNVMSFLGLILLAGIVVNNSIVLLHRGEQRRLGGETVALAIRGAALERFRPIVMTTLTTLLGMLPLALLGGEGVELRRSLALAVIGGSLTGLLASLLVVPTLYRSWVHRGS